MGVGLQYSPSAANVPKAEAMSIGATWTVPRIEAGPSAGMYPLLSSVSSGSPLPYLMPSFPAVSRMPHMLSWLPIAA